MIEKKLKPSKGLILCLDGCLLLVHFPPFLVDLDRS
jgi:hypothetical protein